MTFLSARQDLRPCRAVFRWSLKIGGLEIEHFSEPKISFISSGIGTSGIITSVFSVRTYHEIDLLDIPAGTEVLLTCETDSSVQIPPYYIKTRQADGKFISWTCSDALYIVDTPVDFTDEDFKDGKISAESALRKAVSACGFRGLSCVPAGEGKDLFDLLGIVGDIDGSVVEGKSARDIFGFFAENFCGCWTVSDDNGIVFSPFGRSYRGTYGFMKNAPIRKGGRKRYTKLIMSDGDKVFTAGDGSANETLMISTPLASQKLCSAVCRNISEIEYRAWECDKALTNRFIYPGDIIFSGEDTARLCTNITMYPSAAGIFFSASANAAPETDYAYQSQVQRQLKRKLEIDVRNGNAAYGKDGMKIFQNLNKTADGRKKATVVTAFKSEV